MTRHLCLSIKGEGFAAELQTLIDRAREAGVTSLEISGSLEIEAEREKTRRAVQNRDELEAAQRETSRRERSRAHV